MEKEAARPRAGVKSATAFRTISEVSDELDVPQHVLRFWETKFPQVRPLKRGGGRRYYRPEDVTLLRKIQRLLYSEGYTIKGVQRLLKDQRHLGAESEDIEGLADGLLGAGAGADLAGEEAPEGDEAEVEPEPEPEPQAVPLTLSQIVSVPFEALETVAPLASSPESRPQTVPPVVAVQPGPAPSLHVGGDMPAWLRRELTALRTELTDLRSVLRKAIR